jgi:hypothetical protein
MGAFIRKDASGFLTKETEHGNIGRSFNYYDEEQDPPVNRTSDHTERISNSFFSNPRWLWEQLLPPEVCKEIHSLIHVCFERLQKSR